MADFTWWKLTEIAMRTAALMIAIAISLPGKCDAETPNPSTPSELTNAAATIRRQADWFGRTPANFSYGYALTTAILNHVQYRVSPLNYALRSKAGRKLPNGPEECLSTESGICGNQVATFLELAQRLELRARPVEFYLRGATPQKNHSHIAVEVFYGGRWRFVDVTWGTVFRADEVRIDQLMSASEIIKARNAKQLAVTNQTDLWFQQWNAAGLDPFDYLRPLDRDVLIGRVGTIHIRPGSGAGGAETKWVPTHQPNYIGRTATASGSGGVVVVLLDVRSKVKELTVDVSGVAGSGVLNVTGGLGKPVQIDLAKITPGPLTIDASGFEFREDIRLQVTTENADSVGYLVFASVRIR